MRITDDDGVVHKEEERNFPPHFDEEKGYLFWHRKNFAKTYQDVPFPDSMSVMDIGRMTLLSKKIWSNTNMLGYRGNGGVKPYTVEQLGMIIGCGPRQAHRFVARMIELGVMARVETKVEGSREVQFYINPVYFFSSNRVPLNLYLIFRKQLDAVLPWWVIQRYGDMNQVNASVVPMRYKRGRVNKQSVNLKGLNKE